jgi:hypothetical protein
LLAGWGTQTSKYFSVDPYGFGFALRGAYELESHWVLGVGFEYFIGNSNTAPSTAGVSAAGLVNTRANYLLANAEIGYNLWFSRVIFRPSAWVGASIGTENPPMLSGTSGVATTFSVSPGMTLQYITGNTGWFVGADARINFILGHDGNSGLMFHGMLGKRL